MFDQLLREWPPGYGGVERVAHELALASQGSVWSFDVQNKSTSEIDALPVPYQRHRLPCFPPLGRLFIPILSKGLIRLLFSTRPLHGHLPSPSVLLLLVFARLIRPSRHVTAHWHCFLETRQRPFGYLYQIYQWLALRLLPYFSSVVTTSPNLRDHLVNEGCSEIKVFVLPCSLNADFESVLLSIPLRSDLDSRPLRVLFIGRLDSYKRLDWLLHSLSLVSSPWQLSVVGDGPLYSKFVDLSTKLFGLSSRELVKFHGLLPESDKIDELRKADVLVLPSDSCNEAFGIVQLEAMAAGIPSLAFSCSRSGAGWVGNLSILPWSQSPDSLSSALQCLSGDSLLLMKLGYLSRQRYLSLFSRSVWYKNFQLFNSQYVLHRQ